MKIRYFNLLLILLFFYFGCSSKKDIVYLQDIDNTKLDKLVFNDHIVKSDDILKIDVNSSNPELVVNFNSTASNFNLNNVDIVKINGYKVDNEGFINFPTLGMLNVNGLKLKQIEDLIYKLLFDSGQLINHTVKISLVNARFTALGEVNKPGTYYFYENNMSILEALGLAGDLTINGVRDDVKLIRNINGERVVYNIDLTSSEYLNDIKLLQVISGDVIIVSPNNTRVKNAGIIGNSGTLISLLSFLLSSIIVITR